MRKFLIAFMLLLPATYLLWGENVGDGAALQSSGAKVCRLYKMMTMEGGLCQWYCWNCSTSQPLGEVNSCSAGPGGCSGTFGCFFLPASAPTAPPAEKGPREKAPPVPTLFGGKSGQVIDPINNVGKTGIKRLKKKPKFTENKGTIIDTGVLRFRKEEGGEWRKAFVCVVKYDPPGDDKPSLTVACGREIDVDTPDTPHDLEATEVVPVEEFPFFIEATSGAVTYLIALHEDSNE